jgi:hypothetical protein
MEAISEVRVYLLHGLDDRIFEMLIQFLAHERKWGRN